MNLELGIILLKWTSQALIVIVGVWGLVSDPFAVDSASGQRRLNRAGWLKIALFGVGFLLFVLTDVNERRTSEAQRERQAQQIAVQQKTVETQKTQLAYLRRLILLQYRMSELHLVLEFPPNVMNDMRSSIESYKTKSPVTHEEKRQLVYIATAIRVGTAIVRFDRTGHGELQYSLNRPQGMTGGRFSGADPEWKAFYTAFRGLFGGRFDIQSESGHTLIDVLNPAARTEVTFAGNVVAFNIREPEVRLDDLNGSLSFACGKDALLFVIDDVVEEDMGEQRKRPEERHFCPVTAVFTSKDPRVQWHQKMDLDWGPVVRRRIDEGDTGRADEVGEWHSSPRLVNAAFSGLGLE